VVQIEDKDGGAEGYTFDLTWDARGGQSYNAPPPIREDRRDDGYRRDEGGYRPGYRESEYYRRNNRGFGTNEAIQVCQNEVRNQAQRRFRTNNINFDRTSIDDNPGRNDWVVGRIDVRRGGREERFRFSCSVNFDNGRVRSAQIDNRPF